MNTYKSGRIKINMIVITIKIVTNRNKYQNSRIIKKIIKLLSE